MRPLSFSRRRIFALVVGAVAPFANRDAFAAVLRPLDCPTRDCGFFYDPAIGDPEHGVPPGLAFADLPDDWICPNCGRPKDLWTGGHDD